jgi:hypothetical protein
MKLEEIQECADAVVEEFIRRDIHYGVEHQRHMPDDVKSNILRNIVIRKMLEYEGRKT